MQTYLVGGAVRDRLLGLDVADRDWVVVGGSVQAMLDAGYTQVGKDFPVFLHPETKEEYALARRERKTGSGYTGFACDTEADVSLEDDLLRRDLTINAMAEDASGSIIDPHGGREDLAAGVLRHISPAFVEDPLRVLRTARFAARFADRGFTVHASTIALMREISAGGELQTLPAERIWQELSRALLENSPFTFWQVAQQSGALEVLFPEMDGAIPEQALQQSLTLAAKRGEPLAVRWALSTFALEAAACESLCNRLKLPNDCAQLAKPVNRHGSLAAFSADNILRILESLDFLRRPKLLTLFITTHECLGTSPEKLKLLQNAANAMCGIRASEFAKQGLQGQQLGDAMRQARRSILESLL